MKEETQGGEVNLTSVTQLVEGKTQIFYSKSCFFSLHPISLLPPREPTHIIIIGGRKNKGPNTYTENLHVNVQGCAGVHLSVITPD